MRNQNENQKIDWFEARMKEFIIDDDDASYEDFCKNHKSVEELMKIFPPDQPIDIMEWCEDDFRSYYESLEKGMGKDMAWQFLYAKILERAGEGDGSIEIA